MSRVTLSGIDKIYENGYHAVHDLSIDISDGEFLVLVGPSGCGKSTALRMVAGLESISGGDLKIGDRVVNDVPAKDRDIAMVFQNYALYPHMTVRENIGFALKLRKMSKTEIDSRVDEAARVLELTDWLDRKPGQLSGGQRQRVAMGRAIVRQPSAFLMDEPLSNLDAKLRVQMRSEISRLQRSLKVTTIYVTHDQVEAMTMGDRVAVMSKGLLQQVDTPQNLYDAPDNLFVAAFIGSPQMNLMHGHLRMEGDQPIVKIGSQDVPIPSSVMTAKPGLRRYIDKPLAIGVRPESAEDASLLGETAGRTLLKADVEIREGLGSEVVCHARIDAQRVRTGNEAETVGGEGMNFVARLDPKTRVQEGETIALALDTEALHAFDLDSGLAIRS
jgi:multiple sugar transport system ATP-binding protein